MLFNTYIKKRDIFNIIVSYANNFPDDSINLANVAHHSVNEARNSVNDTRNSANVAFHSVNDVRNSANVARNPVNDAVNSANVADYSVNVTHHSANVARNSMNVPHYSVNDAPNELKNHSHWPKNGHCLLKSLISYSNNECSFPAYNSLTPALKPAYLHAGYKPQTFNP